jgi:hypothetical protein
MDPHHSELAKLMARIGDVPPQPFRWDRIGWESTPRHIVRDRDPIYF